MKAGQPSVSTAAKSGHNGWVNDADADRFTPDLSQKHRAAVCWHTSLCVRNRVSDRCFVDVCRELNALMELAKRLGYIFGFLQVLRTRAAAMHCSQPPARYHIAKQSV